MGIKAALFYGTCTGKTEYIAEAIEKSLAPELVVELVDVSSIEPDDLAKWELVICGIPTWDVGELEYCWADIYDKMDDVDLNGVSVAMFGLGDQDNYADTYQDAMGILYKKLLERGAKGGLGFTSTDGHEFEASLGVIDGKFCGLAIDEDCQDELTDSRIEAWSTQLKKELKVVGETIS